MRACGWHGIGKVRQGRHFWLVKLCLSYGALLRPLLKAATVCSPRAQPQRVQGGISLSRPVTARSCPRRCRRSHRFKVVSSSPTGPEPSADDCGRRPGVVNGR
jgi:hypothetical protein